MPPTRLLTSTLPLSPTVYLILLSLADGDAHGYRIRAEVIARSEGAVTLDPGSLYRLIARLTSDGLIEDAPIKPRSDGDDQRRRYYRLTAFGRRVLRAETQRMADLVSLAQSRSIRLGKRA